MTRPRIGAVKIGSHDAVVLESESLRAVVLPALGGRIWELQHRISGREWIWNCGLGNLGVWPVGAKYDDVWAGGWEELFPNDAAESFEGRSLPDHGEWWARQWDVVEMVDGAEPTLRLAATMSIIPSHCTKEITLSEDGSTLLVRYRIRSESPRPFHFLFKQHLPIRLEAGCLVQLPGGKARCVDPSFGTSVTDPSEFSWPHVSKHGRTLDLRQVPAASSRQREFLYVKDLPQPWCGIDDPGSGTSLRMAFDASDLPYVWLFLTYGGWRGHYTAVLEPCTNCPKSLSEASRIGQSARLVPGQEFSTSVSVTISSSLSKPYVAMHNEG